MYLGPGVGIYPCSYMCPMWTEITTAITLSVSQQPSSIPQLPDWGVQKADPGMLTSAPSSLGANLPTGSKQEFPLGCWGDFQLPVLF